MEKGEFLYEGKAKRIYRTDAEGVLWMEFKDDATAQNGRKRGTIGEKGRVNAEITRRIFEHLSRHGVRTHLVGSAGERVLFVRGMEMFPLEVVVRNVAAGSLVQRIGLEEGKELAPALVEFYLKDDARGDPLLNRGHIAALGIAGTEETAELQRAALAVNAVLSPFFAERDLILVDFKLEFGRLDGEIVLGDEITPDTCRLWDQATRRKLDKDRFRQDLGGVEEAYQEVLRRVVGPNG